MDTAIPMRPHFPGIPHPRRSTPLVILVVAAVVVAGCEASPAPTLSPVRASASPAALATAAATPAFTPTSAPTPLATPIPPAASAAPGSTGDGPLVPGAIAVTVTDGLRVRSLPGVAEDSLRYEPLLAHGTQLVVEAGPVEASGYTWFRVAPVGVKLMDGLQDGWVAVADHDGTPWVALSADPTPGFELASATLAAPAGRVPTPDRGGRRQRLRRRPVPADAP